MTQALRHVAEQRWPNLYLGGVPKAGSRSLAEALGAHPDVFVPVIDCPRYFLDLDIDRSRARFFRVVQDEDEYLALFEPGHDARYLCDSSVEYMFHEQALHRIREVSPHSKLIVILRDPVRRAYSHYLNDVREGIEKRTFEEAVRDQIAAPDAQPWPSRYVAYGHYPQALRNALSIFGEDLLVLLFEELTQRGDEVLAEVGDFLDLSPGAFPRSFGHLNRAAVPRGRLAGRAMGSLALRTIGRFLVPTALRPAARAVLVGARPPALQDSARELLVQEYRPDVEQVAELLGREPPWPSFAREPQ